MSFRKRGEVIGRPNPRIPNAVSGRGGEPVTAPGIPGRAPLGPNVPGRVPPPRDISGMPLPQRGPGIDPLKRTGMHPDLLANQVQNSSVEEIVKHPGVRPSSITSQATVSTGSADLDKILGHQGLPVGSSYLIEESGTTDFSSVLMKSFASQGIVQNRLDPKNPNTHVIVLSSNQAWGKELPGVYKGSSRDIKKNRVLQNEQKLSVQNLLDTGEKPKARASSSSSSSNSEKKDNDLRIAWRYGLNDPKKQQASPLDNETYKDFNHQFDITSRLVPSPNANEITYIPLGSSFKPVIKQLETTIQRHKTKIIRLVIPSFLNPSMYPPPLSTSQEALQFIHSLRSLTRKYSKNLVVAMSIPLELYPRESLLIKQIESLSDAVFNLEPFNQEMLKFLEKAYQNQPTKVQHGLVHVYKVPQLSEKGQMLIMKSEFAFKNGKKKFEIEEWGIPVEDEGDPQQTTQNIEF